MIQRAWYVGIVGAVLAAIGLFALGFPVFLDDYDQYGFQIKCGTGYIADLSQALAATGGPDYAEQCENSLLARRMWTVPLVVIGALAVLGTLLLGAATSAHEKLAHEPEHHLT
ncbi:hypothetical protein [Mycobacterium hubeiense]|uniref:hypothetical protein n=1 Tax=Mycobacterium hubeiense TaxID=1867256 RepID=UPI000C7E9D3D|nr:hypothetical protein [Mycobacterium sp. QGD 101]